MFLGLYYLCNVRQTSSQVSSSMYGVIHIMLPMY